MPLTRRQVLELRTAQDGDDPARLVLAPPSEWGLETSVAVVVARRRGGLMLALPGELRLDRAVLPDRSPFGLDEGGRVETASATDPGEAGEFLTAVRLVDFDGIGFRFLRVRGSRAGDEAALKFTVDLSGEAAAGADPGEVVWPWAPRLVEIAEFWLQSAEDPATLERFFTGEEEEVVAPRAGRGQGRGRGRGTPNGVPRETESRLEEVLVSISSLAERFGSFERRVESLELGRPGASTDRRPSLSGREAQGSSAAPGADSLPPQLAGAIRFAPGALGAGGLESIIGGPPRRLGDGGGARGHDGAGAGPDRDFGGDGVEDDGGDDDGDEAGLPRRDRAFLAALRAQTVALSRALGGSGDSGDFGDSSVFPSAGARGTAALDAQRRAFEKRPDRAVKATRELLAQASGTNPAQLQDARAFFERHGTFRSNSQVRDFGYAAFLLAEIWNKLEVGEVAAAQALVGRGMAAVDQVSKGGSASMGFLWTHLPEPPWGIIDRPSRAEQRPYSALAPPSLVAASVAYLKDMDAMAERLGRHPPRASGGGGGGKSEEPEKPKGAQKEKPKGGGRGRGGGAADP